MRTQDKASLSAIRGNFVRIALTSTEGCNEVGLDRGDVRRRFDTLSSIRRPAVRETELQISQSSDRVDLASKSISGTSGVILWSKREGKADSTL